MNDNQKGGNGFMLGMFVGGLLGALTIFFLGTKEGKKAGKALEKKGRELLGDVLERVEDLEDKGRELFARGEDLKDEIKMTLEDKKDQLTEEAVSKIDRVLENIESLQQKGIETTENLRKHFKNLPKKTSIS